MKTIVQMFARPLMLCLMIVVLGSLVSQNSQITVSLEVEASEKGTLSALPCVDGMAGEYPCQNVDLMAFLPLLEMGAVEDERAMGGWGDGAMGGGARPLAPSPPRPLADGGTDIWGWTDSQDGKEYALMGLKSGTSFVDLSDPENPIYLGKLAGHNDSISGWRDIKVYKDHAFIVSEAIDHGIQIFDLTQLRSISSPPMTFTETAHYDGFGRRHNIVINEESGFAYGAGSLNDQRCGGGLHAVNIQNPSQPTFAGCFSEAGYIHDAQCVIYKGPDTLYQGREICFNANADALTIADLTDKAFPILLADKIYEGNGYAHQGWLTDDHAYFLLGDEYDEVNDGYNTSTYIWDVSDLHEPALIGIYRGETAAIDHNLYTRGDYVYESNYSAGLRILESSQIANGTLSEVGYFDIHPADDEPNTNGSWSNYPYFDSGVIIVSGRQSGLFIVRPTLPSAFTVQASRHQLNVCQDESTSLEINVGAIHGYEGSVGLSIEDLPLGLSADFKPQTLSVPAQSDLTLNLSDNLTGTHRLTISGSDEEVSHQDKLTLHIDAIAPISPTLNQPPNKTTEVSLMPTFTWAAIPNAQSYQLELATDATFSDTIYSATTISPTDTINQSLNPKSSYYWRVSAQNSCGEQSSTSFHFTTENRIEIFLPLLSR